MTAVRESFQRVHDKGLAHRFYDIFLDADPRIKPLFKDTDFARQKELFMHGLLMLLEYDEGRETGKMALHRLGELHSRKKMNIAPEMFAIWVNCLMKTLTELDPEFSPELETQWRHALQKGIAVIIKMY